MTVLNSCEVAILRELLQVEKLRVNQVIEAYKNPQLIAVFKTNEQIIVSNERYLQVLDTLILKLAGGE